MGLENKGGVVKTSKCEVEIGVDRRKRVKTSVGVKNE